MSFSDQISSLRPAPLPGAMPADAAPGACALGGVARLVTGIIAAQAGLDPAEVRAASTIESLGLDSLGLVETIFALEERFDISVPFNANDPGRDGFDITSVGAIIAAVERLVAGKAA